MNLLPDDKRKNDAPRPFPLKIVAAVVLLVAVVAIIIFTQVNARRPTGYDDPMLSQGQMFRTAFLEMATSVKQGTPMNNSNNPIILTAKALGGAESTQSPSSENNSKLTITALLQMATEQAGTPKP